jgi:fermentation-respiration switch protein FrsA (DUF1100 family)
VKVRFCLFSLFFFSLLQIGCSSLLYYPTRSQYVEVKKLAFVPKEKTLTLSSGLTIHGWHFRAAEAKPKALIIFFHGNGQNRSSHFAGLYWLVGEGYDLITYDYPGYGQSGGSPSPKNTVETAVAVLRKSQLENPTLPLIVYGQSLGGAISMRALWELRNELKPNLVIADSTVLSYQKIARKILAKSAWTWLFQPLAWLTLSDKWAPAERIQDLAGTPFLVIHSKTDKVIPYEFGEEIFAQASEPKQFWTKTTGEHGATFYEKEGHDLKKSLLRHLEAVIK